MESNENNIKVYDTISYILPGSFDKVVSLEDICKELNIDLEIFWEREPDEDEWFPSGDIITSKWKPQMPERYDLVYAIPLEPNTEKVSKFAAYIIDRLLKRIEQLEACLEMKGEENDN